MLIIFRQCYSLEVPVMAMEVMPANAGIQNRKDGFSQRDSFRNGFRSSESDESVDRNDGTRVT